MSMGSVREAWERLRGRRRCDIGAGVTFYPGARIDNNRQDSGAIRIGAESHIRGQLFTFAHGGRIDVGAWCYLGEQARIWSAASVSVGNRVLLSHNVNIFDSLTHPMSASARHEQFRTIVKRGHPDRIDLAERPVIIEDDVLIGCLSVVLPGVRIGTGAVIGAGSVVTSDIPPWTVFAGNPARMIRELSPDER
jgi:acetyltransferase-like isoleucine patch superfamily enzyme